MIIGSETPRNSDDYQQTRALMLEISFGVSRITFSSFKIHVRVIWSNSYHAKRHPYVLI
jgi:hypothetical protein